MNCVITTIVQSSQASLLRLNDSHWEVQSSKQRIIRYSTVCKAQAQIKG